MIRKFIPCVILLYFFSLSTSLVVAQTKKLNVGLAGGAPFVVTESQNKPSGIAVEIWENVATKNNWQFEYTKFSSVKNALAALDSQKVDLVVGPISITAERVTHIRFSQPYYQSSLAIASRLDKPTLWERVAPFFSFKLLIAVFIFLFILALVGTLLWLAERKASPEQFTTKPLSGIGNGMWLAIVTMSTTGYGDKAPITLTGRIITASWMLISIIFATSMIAGIASTLTLSGLGDDTIKNIEQLEGKITATISGSPAEVFLKDHNAKELAVSNLQQAFSKLKNKDVDAVVYDRPQLLYYLKNNTESKLFISKAEYYKQGYGFAFPIGTTLTHPVNLKLLELAEVGETEKTIRKWIGKDE